MTYYKTGTTSLSPDPVVQQSKLARKKQLEEVRKRRRIINDKFKKKLEEAKNKEENT
jgi:hypothetical protein